jgi:hypothetical protein
MIDTPDHRIATLARSQHAIFTVDQADRAGLTRDQRDTRVRAGRWQLVHPGVYRMAGAPDSWRGRLLAACWATEGLAAASHRSAAELWDLPGASTEMLEITGNRGARSFVDGLVVHETSLLLLDEITELDGIPVTTIEQTLLGLAAVRHPSVVEMALDRALHRELTTKQDLEAFVDRTSARGRNGIRALRQILQANGPLVGVPESAMETSMKRLLRRRGLPPPVFQYVIRHEGRFVARVDAAYPELRIAMEYDSFEHHTGKLALVRDTDRRNQVTKIRWQTVTFTAADLRRDGGQAIEALRVAHAAASGVPRAG